MTQSISGKELVDIITKHMYNQRIFGDETAKFLSGQETYMEYSFSMCDRQEDMNFLDKQYASLLKTLREKHNAKSLSFKHFVIFVTTSFTHLTYCFFFKNKYLEVTHIDLDSKLAKEFQAFAIDMQSRNRWGTKDFCDQKEKKGMFAWLF